MSAEEQQKLIKNVKDVINRQVEVTKLSDEELRRKIEDIVTRQMGNLYIPLSDRWEIVSNVYNAFRGLGGLLDSIMKDNTITEVMVNGPDNIFVEKKGVITKLDRHFENEEDLTSTVRRIANQAHMEVSPASPICDLVLEDGSRVNIVVPPISLEGSTITIRKFFKDPMTMEKLIAFGSLSADIAEFLRKLVVARYNIFVAGGTGSGKTTFLNALSNYIPRTERIITIEDAPELQIVNVPNIVRMQTRRATASSGKEREITIQDLIKSSLRMRPDRIVVGEVRGAEALDMLQAMNTGHDGSLSTGHANSARDMISRLETMVLQGSSDLPLLAVRQQIASAVDIMVFLSRLRDHSRKTMMITEILDKSAIDTDLLTPEVARTISPDTNIILNPLFAFEEDEEQSSLHKVVGKLVRTRNPMIGTEKFFRAGFVKADII